MWFETTQKTGIFLPGLNKTKFYYFLEYRKFETNIVKYKNTF